MTLGMEAKERREKRGRDFNGRRCAQAAALFFCRSGSVQGDGDMFFVMIEIVVV